jgi:hypothetical protein
MSPSLFRIVRQAFALAAVMIACGASFAIGYRAGYHEGWIDAWIRIDSSQIPPVSLNLLNQNKPGR